VAVAEKGHTMAEKVKTARISYMVVAMWGETKQVHREAELMGIWNTSGESHGSKDFHTIKKYRKGGKYSPPTPDGELV